MLDTANDFAGFRPSQRKLGVFAQAHGVRAAAEQAGADDFDGGAIGETEIGQAAANGVIQFAKFLVGLNGINVGEAAFGQVV